MSYLGLINIEAAASGGGITASSTDTLTNKTITDTSNDVAAKSLHSATTAVDVSAATAPTAGQVLTATSSTAATWQTAGGGAEFTATAKTASYTAVSGDWVVYDLSAAGAAVTLTLPASPTLGDAVKVSLGVANAAPTTIYVGIGRNSSTIDGGTAAEFENYNILWKAGDTVTFRCVASGAWITSERQIANRFMFRSEKSLDQSIASGVFTVVTYPTENYDYNGNFDSVTNNEYTAPITGKYMLAASARMNAIPDAREILFRVRKDTGGGYADLPLFAQFSMGAVCNASVALSDIIELNQGDKIKLELQHNSGVNRDAASGGNVFGMYLISR